jgi:hypothetical protein
MRRMRTAIMAAALIGLIGVVSSRGQTNVMSQFDVMFSGKLVPSGTKVNGESLSGNTNTLAAMVTDDGVFIGESAVVAGVTNLTAAYLKETSRVTTGTGKSIDVFTGVADASNAVWLADFGAASTGFKVKLSGVWIDGTNMVSGTVSTVKPKKS